MAIKQLFYSDVERARLEQRLKDLRARVLVLETGGGGSGGSIEFYGGSLAVAHPTGAVEVRGGAL